ncbi:MAG: hypothetical protein Q6363_004885 [Candidatus Njordarchaeota archaeon]
MSTIYISKETKKELVRIAGELQAASGKRVNFDDIVRMLIKEYHNKQRRKKLFEKFTEPIEGLDFESIYQDLLEERKRELR